MDTGQLKKRFEGMITNMEYWLGVPDYALTGYAVEYNGVTLAGNGDYYFEDVNIPETYAKDEAEKLAKSVTVIRNGNEQTFYNGKAVEVREWLKQRIALYKECLKLLSNNKDAVEMIVLTENNRPRYGVRNPNDKTKQE